MGEGRNRADAVEQAKKNAVREVIFNGIHDGNSSCDQRPLLNIPNAEERYREYFKDSLLTVENTRNMYQQ